MYVVVMVIKYIEHGGNVLYPDTFIYETDTAQTPMQAMIQCRDAWGDDNDGKLLLIGANYTIIAGKKVQEW